MNRTDLREHIQAAAVTGDLPLLRRLVESFGADTVRLEDDPEELTTLHYACSSGHIALVNYLLSPAVASSPTAARNNAFTPLHAAAMNGHADICEVLLARGADVNAQTSPQRYAPLHSAAFAGHRATVVVLLSFGADARLRNYRDETPAATAQRTGQFDVAALLASHVGS